MAFRKDSHSGVPWPKMCFLSRLSTGEHSAPPIFEVGNSCWAFEREAALLRWYQSRSHLNEGNVYGGYLSHSGYIICTCTYLLRCLFAESLASKQRAAAQTLRLLPLPAKNKPSSKMLTTTMASSGTAMACGKPIFEGIGRFVLTSNDRITHTN